MTTVTDGVLRALRLQRVTDREVARRVRSWRRKKAFLTPALWMVALAGAFVSWFARRDR